MDKHELLDCITKADKDPAPIDKTVLSGLSGAKIVALLKNLALKIVNNDVTYLEVGVFQGLTLLSVAGSVPEYEVFGIDNFAFFDRDGRNLAIIRDRMSRLKIENARIINEDFEEALETLGKFTGNKKVGFFFIDGPHDYRSQLMCLLLIKPLLTENAVIIIDDCNYRHVRQANKDFLKTNPDFKLIFQAYTPAHPSNLSDDERKDAETGWWNGINLIARDPGNVFEPFFPPVPHTKTLFENDHIIHTARYPEAFRKYSRIINLLASLRGAGSKKNITGKFRSLNTFSDNLTIDNYNPSFFSSSV